MTEPDPQVEFDIWQEIQRATQAFYPTAPQPTYWDEKRLDRCEEFAEEDDINAQRAYPERRP